MKPKEPLLAVYLNLLFLGLGHIYSGARKSGFLILSAFIAFQYIFFSWICNPSTNLRFLSSVPTSESIALLLVYVLILSIVIAILIDGYKQARSFNGINNLERTITKKSKVVLLVLIVLAILGLNLNLIISGIIRNFYLQAFRIPSPTMRPTLLEGDRLLADKTAYRKNSPQRGDVIVFRYPKDPSRDFVKRIVALGGEEIEIKEGNIYVDDRLIEDKRIKDNYYYNYGNALPGIKIKVPDNSYFVLGDNSAKSSDSRYWGPVPAQNIIGKAYKIYYPLSRSGPIE